MTDLENLWDDLPTGPPPVDAILRGSRAAGARRRKFTRPLIVVAAAAALVAAFVAGSAFGGIPGSGGGKPNGAPSPVAFQADLKPAQSCSQLLESYRDRALAMVTEWGWGGDPNVYGGLLAYGPAVPVRGLSDLAADSGTPQQSQTSSATGTNVQESAVDEPDTVKTDGKLVVRLRDDELIVYDASGATVVKRSSLHLPDVEEAEILLDGTTVVAIGSDQLSPPDAGIRRGSRVVTVSIADPSKPTIKSTVTYSSRVISARQQGSVVRLVLAAGLPALNFIRPDGKKVTKQKALAANRLAIEMSTINDWLPSYDAGKGSKPLLDCSNVAIPPDSLGLDTVSVVGFNVTTPTRVHAIGLAGAATIAYESANHLYLADESTQWNGCLGCMERAGAMIRTGGGTTHLYDFALDGVNAIHVASGQVKGTIADRWSMDEADDVLRVAVSRWNKTGNLNSVVTFRRVGQDLVEIGRLDHLGSNEDLKAVRWFDDLAVVVTYREVDPLFTIDLADPTHPRLVGKLKIPGYSDYLHPLGNDQMLGIGRGDGSGGFWGGQIALFDISDLAHVKRTDIVRYLHGEPVASSEPRAFTWLPNHDTALTVIQKDRTIDIATLKVAKGHLTSTLTKVAHGEISDQVRTFGLPDGRVVLVTNKDVRLFDLP